MIIQCFKNKYHSIKQNGIRLYIKVFLHAIKLFILKKIPIKRNTIFFESEGDFCDNSWALYKFLQKKNKYKFIWLVTNLDEFRDSEDTHFISWKNNFDEVLYHYSTAKYIFYTHCMYREYKKKANQIVVDLEHGCGFKAGKNSSGNYLDYVAITGNFAKKAFAIYKGCSEEKVIVLGYPRNDILISNLGSGKTNPLFKNYDYNKLIIWMPTFRASTNPELSEQSIDTETGLPLLATPNSLVLFDSFLQENNILLVIKTHHLQAPKSIPSNLKNFLFFTDDFISKKGFQLYEIIGKSDALLTDYSSISIDYILANKPMGFILDDYEDYKKCRGFKYKNVKSMMPGHHIYNTSDLKQFMLDIASNKDPHQTDRNRLLPIFQEIPPGKNCETFCNFFHL